MLLRPTGRERRSAWEKTLARKRYLRAALELKRRLGGSPGG
jgi:hypothetical protein